MDNAASSLLQRQRIDFLTGPTCHDRYPEPNLMRTIVCAVFVCWRDKAVAGTRITVGQRVYWPWSRKRSRHHEQRETLVEVARQRKASRGHSSSPTASALPLRSPPPFARD